MKQIIFFLALLLAFQNGSAQLFTKEKVANNIDNIDKKPLTWGYFLGFNQYDFKFEYNEDLKDILVDNSFGFHLGLIGDMRINDYFNLRLEPGVFFSTRNMRYDESYFEGQDFNDSDLLREVKSTYVHIPLLIKASTKRINNFKPFIVGGLSTSINLSSNENNPDVDTRLRTNNYHYEVGLGIDLYLYYFKFSPSIRGVFTINNEMVETKFSAVDAMRSQAVFLNFTFQ
jgi:hypothetical protein